MKNENKTSWKTARKLVVLAAVFIAWSLTASIQAGADEIACRFEQQLSCNASAGETEIISFYKAENSHVVQTDAQYKTPSGEPVSVNPGGPGGKICCTSFAAPVQVKPSCDAGYSALFSVYKTTSNNVVENSHVGLPGNTAPYKLCAKTTQGVSQTSCAPKTACDEASDEWPLFSVYSSAFDERGSHVAKKEASTGYKWCCSNTQTLNADPNAVCNNNGDCETALGENAGNCIADCAETNLHIGCSAPDASGTLQEAPCRVDCSRMFCDSLQSLQTISKLAEKKFEEAKKDGKYDDDAHLKSKGWVDKTKIGDEGRTYQLPISFDVFTMEDTLSNNTLKDVNVYSRKAAGLTMTKLLSSEWTGFEWLSTKGSDTIGTGMYLVDSSSVTESCENKKDLCLKLKIKDTPNELKCGKKKVVLAMEIFIAQNGTTARRAVATIEHVNDSETGKKCDSYPYLHLPLDAPLLDEYFKASGSVFKKTETDPAKNDPDPDVGVKVSLKTDLTGDAGALADFRRLELLTGPLMAEKYPNLLLNAASTTLKTLSNRPAGAKGVPVEAGVIDSFKTGFYFQAGTSGTPHAPLLLMPRYNPTRARITATGNVSLHPSIARYGVPQQGGPESFSKWLDKSANYSIASETVSVGEPGGDEKFKLKLHDIKAETSEGLLPVEGGSATNTCAGINNDNAGKQLVRFGHFTTGNCAGAQLGTSDQTSGTFFAESKDLLAHLYENIDWCNRNSQALGSGCAVSTSGQYALDIVRDIPNAKFSLSYNLVNCAKTTNCKYPTS